MIDHYADEPGMKEEYRVLLNKMIEDEKIEEGAHAGVLPTAKEERQVKEVANIMKRYLVRP